MLSIFSKKIPNEIYIYKNYTNRDMSKITLMAIKEVALKDEVSIKTTLIYALVSLKKWIVKQFQMSEKKKHDKSFQAMHTMLMQSMIKNNF